MRKGISTLAVIAILAQVPVAAKAPSSLSQNQRRSSQCRTPMPLPQLGVERWNRQQPRPMPVSAPRGGTDEDRSIPVAESMPAPPPPVMARESRART